VLSGQLLVLGNIAVVEIVDPKVNQNIENEAQIEQSEVNSIFLLSYFILHLSINPQNVQGFHQHVEQQNQAK